MYVYICIYICIIYIYIYYMCIVHIAWRDPELGHQGKLISNGPMAISMAESEALQIHHPLGELVN